MARRRLSLLVVAGLAGSLLAATPATIVAAATVSGPQVGIGDVAVTEPTAKSGTVTVQVPVTIAPAPSSPVSVTWKTVAGTATTADFVAASGTATIPAGANGTTIAVQVKADRSSEPAEAFSVQLGTANGATVVRASGQVTIRTTTAAGLAVGDVTVLVPDGGSVAIGVPVTLSQAYKKAVSFTWQLRSGTGTVGTDVVAASGTSTIPGGSLGIIVPVTVLGAALQEADEAVSLAVTSVAGAPLALGTGTITLRHDLLDPFGWTPPAGAVPAQGTVLYVQSTPGDYIGQGQTYLYTKANSLLTVSTSGGRVDFSVAGDQRWSGSIAEPSSNLTVQPGIWTGVGRYQFYVPGVTFTGQGRGCNTVVGSFIVDQAGYQAGMLQTLTVRFSQQCDGGPALFGFLRFDAADPTLPPLPAAPSTFTWMPPAGSIPNAGSFLYLSSTPGDYIGGGQTKLFTSTDSTFTVSSSGNAVHFQVVQGSYVEWWQGDFAGIYTQSQLATGVYVNVERYPFNNPATGGLDVGGDGRGCNTLLGSFAVDQIGYDSAGLSFIQARFVQDCEVTGPPLYGMFVWSRGR